MTFCSCELLLLRKAKKNEKILFGLNLHQSKSGVISILVVMVVGRGGWGSGSKNESCSE